MPALPPAGALAGRYGTAPLPPHALHARRQPEGNQGCCPAPAVPTGRHADPQAAPRRAPDAMGTGLLLALASSPLNPSGRSHVDSPVIWL